MDLEKADDGLDDILSTDISTYQQPESPVIIKDLDRVAANESIMHQHKGKSLDRQECTITLSNGENIRITTDRTKFEKHSDSMEFWSPGSPVFPDTSTPDDDMPKFKTLKQLLDSIELYGS